MPRPGGRGIGHGGGTGGSHRSGCSGGFQCWQQEEEEKGKQEEEEKGRGAAEQKQLWEMLGRKARHTPRCDRTRADADEQSTFRPAGSGCVACFLRAEYPEKEEGKDYRVRDPSRFREWRRYLEPISHYLSLLSSKSHRACMVPMMRRQNHIHVFQSCCRCEIEGRMEM